MDRLIKNYVSMRTGATSEKGVVSDALCYNGSLLEDEDGNKYFYRKRNRLKEIIAGRPEGYSLGLEDYIIHDLIDRGVKYILIETEYKKYKIGVDKFSDNCFHYGFGNEVSCCIIDLFEVNEIEEKTNKEKPKKIEKKEKKPKVTYGDQGSLFIWFLIFADSGVLMYSYFL